MFTDVMHDVVASPPPDDEATVSARTAPQVAVLLNSLDVRMDLHAVPPLGAGLTTGVPVLPLPRQILGHTYVSAVPASASTSARWSRSPRYAVGGLTPVITARGLRGGVTWRMQESGRGGTR
ncbi:MAG TPA: hypothetical protein VIQ02_16010 [Jiangellaceae bacterium]